MYQKKMPPARHIAVLTHEIRTLVRERFQGKTFSSVDIRNIFAAENVQFRGKRISLGQIKGSISFDRNMERVGYGKYRMLERSVLSSDAQASLCKIIEDQARTIQTLSSLLGGNTAEAQEHMHQCGTLTTPLADWKPESPIPN